jgi:hypothetical protein
LEPVTPLQKVAMGLVIVLLDVPFHGYDAIPDPLGWVLVVVGVLQIRELLRGSGTLLAVAGLSLVVSLVVYLPQVGAHLSPSMGWLLSVPQLAFTFLLCADLARTGAGADAPEAGRFRVMRWVFLVVAAAPTLALGAHLDRLVVPIATLAVLATVYLVYLLFKVSQRTWTTVRSPA